MDSLLSPDDPHPVELITADAPAPVVLTCEHSGRALPQRLSAQAPPAEDMERHIALDIGAAEVARGLARRLGAPLVLQPYSRLVIDCNRPRHAPDLMPPVADGSVIPFNQGLADRERDARWRAIHQPFHYAVSELLDRSGPVALVSLHSFTPKLRQSAARWMHAGLLVRQDGRLAESMQAAMRSRAPELTVVLNEPYQIDDETDYTIPVHGEGRGLPHVLLEIRHDMIADSAGAERWADLLAFALDDALPRLSLE